jgi:hypothetical protein
MASCAQAEFLPGFVSHSLQFANNLPRLPVKAIKGRNDFETFCNSFVREDYLNGRLSVILDVTTCRDVDAVSDVSLGRNQTVKDATAFVLEFHAINLDEVDDWNKEDVFIVQIQGIDGANVGVPSFVRFHAFNHKVEDGRGLAYFSCLREVAYKFLPRIRDWKMRPLGQSGGAEFFNGSAPSKIESASQIVDCISRKHRDICFEGSISQGVIKELLPRLSIDLAGGWVSIGRSVDSLLNIRDVLLGPFDL